MKAKFVPWERNGVTYICLRCEGYPGMDCCIGLMPSTKMEHVEREFFNIGQVQYRMYGEALFPLELEVGTDEAPDG